MADKKKMSVTEMLAAARKADGGGGTAAPAPKPTGEPAAEKPRSSAPAKPAAKTDGSRPSVADILAMARQKASVDEPTKPAVEAKPKPKPAPVAAKATAVKEPPSGPVDTQSILTAARGTTKPGPMSKSEAAAKGKIATDKQSVKPAIIVPPMPVKPDYAKPKAAAEKSPADRRTVLSALAIGFTALGVTFVAWTFASVRFMFPNWLREPPSRFKVGFPDSFPPGSVDERFKAQFGVWIVNAEYNGELQLVALKTVCTHLGCTPNWLDAEQKFKCPCHGSGFYKDGINFEGPAPRPLERYAIALADDGQVEVDKSRIFQEEMGQWNDPLSFIPV